MYPVTAKGKAPSHSIRWGLPVKQSSSGAFDAGTEAAATEGLRNISPEEASRRYTIAAVGAVLAIAVHLFVVSTGDSPRYWRLASSPAIGIAVGLYRSAECGI